MGSKAIQFQEELLVVNPDLEVIGTYINNRSKIRIRCKKCGFEWDGNPGLLLKGQQCKQCK